MASTGALTEASELQTAPRADSTLSSVSVMSLNRTTEKEGILVDVGFCDLEDPTFGDAAHRLAVIEKEESEPSSPQSSSRSLKSRASSGFGDASKRPPIKGNSGRSLKSNSSRSFGGMAGSRISPQTDSIDSSQSRGGLQSVDSGFSFSGADSLPPGSPFGNPSFQSLDFQSPGVKGPAAQLDNMGGVDGRLLSGLKSLTDNELSTYLKLTEELRKECQSLEGSPVTSGTGGSKGDEQLLEEAIRKLRALLPSSAIQQLESHSSYGLMDMVQATASSKAPPPTPVSPTNSRQA